MDFPHGATTKGFTPSAQQATVGIVVAITVVASIEDQVDWGATALTALHVLVGAGWMGSTYYAFTVLHPRTPELIESDQQAEDYLIAITHGNRYRVGFAFAVTLLSGLLLIAIEPQQRSADELWRAMIGAKLGLWCLTLALFVYVSWKVYPARIFAVGEEIVAFRRRGTILRASMLSLVALNTIFGVIAHAL
jgi:uncharacterized membrane protein